MSVASEYSLAVEGLMTWLVYGLGAVSGFCSQQLRWGIGSRQKTMKTHRPTDANCGFYGIGSHAQVFGLLKAALASGDKGEMTTFKF